MGKLVLIMICAFCVQASAFKGSAQSRVTLKLEKATLKKVLAKIEDQTSIHFVYNDEQIASLSKLDVDFKNLSWQKGLEILLKNTKLSYKILGENTVVLTGFPIQYETTITGKIVNKDNVGIEGVSVVEKGTTNGVSTDANGEFTIQVKNESSELEISHVGYQTQVVLASTSKLNIVLKEVNTTLDSVVVIGYGAVNRKTVTGAIASIKGDALNTSSNTNVLQALAGRVPGLSALQTTGQPGASVSVKIRDNPSFASTGVLYVVDGVPFNNSATDPGNNPVYGGGGSDQSPLNFINPNDIESIEVLKDASSAAIYGAQAGGGVVLITTKKGKSGSAKVEYGFNGAFQKMSKFYDIFDTKDYMEQRNGILYEKYLRDNKLAPYGTANANSVAAFVPRYTQTQIDTTPNRPNAMTEITRKGFVQQHNLSISGTSGKTQYYISGNYLDQKGVIRGSDYKRYNARINLTQTISDKIKVGISAISSNSTTNNQSIGSGQTQDGGIIVSALYWPANLPLQNPDGSYTANTDYPAIPNPLSYLT
ncbi:MAG: hypothetical protein DI598_09800, partial [Pseudopedobacter saltans]